MVIENVSKFHVGDVVHTNINECPFTYVVVNCLYFSQHTIFTDWIDLGGVNLLGFESGWSYVLVDCNDINEHHVFLHQDWLSLEVL